MSKLLNPNFKKAFLVDIYDAFLVDDNGNVIISDTLTSCQIEQSTSSTTIKGGKGNATIATLSSSKELTITLESPDFNFDLMAAQMGAEIVEGVGKVMCCETIEVAQDKSITLAHTPLSGVNSITKIYSEQGDLLVESITTKKITLATTSASKVNGGDTVRVVYEANTDATAEKITITGDSFAGTYKLYLTTYIIDNSDKKLVQKSYYFPKAKLSSDFSTSVSSERTGNTNSYALTIMAENNVLGTCTIYKEDLMD